VLCCVCVFLASASHQANELRSRVQELETENSASRSEGNGADAEGALRARLEQEFATQLSTLEGMFESEVGEVKAKVRLPRCVLLSCACPFIFYCCVAPYQAAHLETTLEQERHAWAEERAALLARLGETE